MLLWVDTVDKQRGIGTVRHGHLWGDRWVTRIALTVKLQHMGGSFGTTAAHRHDQIVPAIAGGIAHLERQMHQGDTAVELPAAVVIAKYQQGTSAAAAPVGENQQLRLAVIIQILRQPAVAGSFGLLGACFAQIGFESGIDSGIKGGAAINAVLLHGCALAAHHQ